MSQQDKIDRVVMALLWMSRSQDDWEMPNGELVRHASTAFDPEILERLQAQGHISEYRRGRRSVTLQEQGEREGRKCFEALFGEP